jgi:hypothetical protein
LSRQSCLFHPFTGDIGSILEDGHLENRMALKVEYLTLLLVATAAASIAVAPVATADPVWPVAGAESAADTIRDLEDQGYNVAINWVNGYSSGNLSRCSVRAIHNPDRSATSPPPEATTVYVDVDCPHDHDWGGSFGFGIGFGF